MSDPTAALKAAIRRERVILEQLANADGVVWADIEKVNAALDRLWIMAEDVLPAARRPDQPEIKSLRDARNALKALEAALGEPETPLPPDSPTAERPAPTRTLTVGRPRKPRRARRPAIRPLTSKQAEAVQLVGEHKGNVSEAAKVAGISRQAMKKRYEEAMKKLGKAALPKPKTQRLPRDRRGQEIV